MSKEPGKAKQGPSRPKEQAKASNQPAQASPETAWQALVSDQALTAGSGADDQANLLGNRQIPATTRQR